MLSRACNALAFEFSPSDFNHPVSNRTFSIPQLATGKLSKNGSYVPAGLTKEQYEKVRNKDTKSKADNYAKNVAKAGKFLDYTEFYINRGTDTNDKWAKDTNLGHRMCKTKYDWSGEDNEAKGWFSK